MLVSAERPDSHVDAARMIGWLMLDGLTRMLMLLGWLVLNGLTRST